MGAKTYKLEAALAPGLEQLAGQSTPLATPAGRQPAPFHPEYWADVNTVLEFFHDASSIFMFLNLSRYLGAPTGGLPVPQVGMQQQYSPLELGNGTLN